MTDSHHETDKTHEAASDAPDPICAFRSGYVDAITREATP